MKSAMHMHTESRISALDGRATVDVIDAGRRLDARAAERMRSRVKKFAAQGRERHVIDLSRLVELDSTGLAVLVSALRAAREAGGSVHLVASSERITRILELTALAKIFKVHRSLQDALDSLEPVPGGLR